MSEWQAVLDKESGEYYYWNVKTQETTWDKPKELESKQEIQEMDYNSKEYYDWYMEQMTENAQKEATRAFASFNKKDQYQALSMLTSEVKSEKHTRAFNQMGMFFDVQEYAKEMAAEKMKPKKQQKLTKKQVEKYKKKKEQRKKESLIFRLGTE